MRKKKCEPLTGVAENGRVISVVPANTNASNEAESCLETETERGRQSERERERARPKKETEVNPEIHNLKPSGRLNSIKFSEPC